MAFAPISSYRLPLRAVIFDVDGTLVDSNAQHARAWAEALAEANYDIPFERIRPLIGMGGDNLVPKLIPLDGESEEARALGKRATEIFEQRYLQTIHQFPLARELVREVKLIGCRTAVASSADGEILDQLLEKAQVSDLIDVIISSSDVSSSKPEADVVTAALSKLGLKAQEVILIGDTPYDIEAAARTGVPVIALRCGGHSDQSLSGAAAIYDSPADLHEKFYDSPLGERAERDPSAAAAP